MLILNDRIRELVRENPNVHEIRKVAAESGLSSTLSPLAHPADDNAAGVAMMLEVARSLALSAEPPKRSVIFLGFDLEEISTQDSVVNGIRTRSSIIGPIRVRLGDRHSDLNARVQGREILLRGISPAMLGQTEAVSRPSPANPGRKR